MDSPTEVLAVVPKASDMQTHVRLKDVDGVRVVELRDFIVSSKEYGRGYWIPCDRQVIRSLIEALVEASNDQD